MTVTDPVDLSTPDEDPEPHAQKQPVTGVLRRRVLRSAVWVRRFLGSTVFSSLTRRIVILNLAALAALVIGILYLNQWRAGLIDVRIQSLRIQGEIISAAIAASATVDSDVISVNPDRLLGLQTDATVSPLSFFDPTLEFPISPVRVAPLLGNLVTPTKTRARIYDREGLLILDSANLLIEGNILSSPAEETQPEFFLIEWWNALVRWVPGNTFSIYQEYGPNEGKRYPEVSAALTGGAADIVRVDPKGRMVITVAVPVRRLRAIVGVLLLSTQPGDIDSIVASERLNILRLALVASLVTSVLSFLLAGTIAGPMRKLSDAAEHAGTSLSSRTEIPDFTDRGDEIGHLSGALRTMTNALYNRIEGIERFAADVAHELKNPLTSLRSAVETLPLAKTDENRERLTNIIQHDVRRLDRLISDISNASRLDAEMARAQAEKVEIDKLVEAIVSIQRDVASKRHVNVVLQRPTHDPTSHELFVIYGHDSRLGQVVNNLIDNAVSFSPNGGTVEVALSVEDDDILLKVTDEGPGIRGDVARIFQRFYTDRPDGEHFGDHSGLGLSISQQVVEAHKGNISAENRTDHSGAIFTVRLPRGKNT